jgi:hypothetical protein
MKFQHYRGMWDCWGNDGSYDIEANDDGTFSASYTDDVSCDTDEAGKSFDTFKEAVAWCVDHEAKLRTKIELEANP